MGCDPPPVSPRTRWAVIVIRATVTATRAEQVLGHLTTGMSPRRLWRAGALFRVIQRMRGEPRPVWQQGLCSWPWSRVCRLGSLLPEECGPGSGRASPSPPGRVGRRSSLCLPPPQAAGLPTLPGGSGKGPSPVCFPAGPVLRLSEGSAAPFRGFCRSAVQHLAEVPELSGVPEGVSPLGPFCLGVG